MSFIPYFLLALSLFGIFSNIYQLFTFRFDYYHFNNLEYDSHITQLTSSLVIFAGAFLFLFVLPI
jgi:hypothetical protein